MHYNAKIFSVHRDQPVATAPPRFHLAYSTCQNSPQTALPQRRSTDPSHAADHGRDELRPARGILWSALIGGGIWAVIWLACWFIAH